MTRIASLKQTLFAASAAALLSTPVLAQTVNIDGSSTVYPITAAVAEEFKKSENINVQVGVSGTGGGFRKFIAGETDISNASRAITALEIKAAADNNMEFVEVPVAYDGVTVVVNRANTWAKELSLDDLRKIFTAPGVKTWQELNPSFPNTPVKLYTPGEASGTFDYFTEVVLGRKDRNTGRYEHGELRNDLSRSANPNILVTGISGDPGAIGFFGCSYYFENQDKVTGVAIVNSKGKAVAPSPKTIENGTYEPFSRPLFIYVNVVSLRKPEVRKFVDFYLSEGPELAEEVGNVRLPRAVYDAARRKVAGNETGSVYADGKHGSITELYR